MNAGAASSRELLQLPDERRLGDEPTRLEERLAIPEEDEGGNATDLEAVRGLGSRLQRA